MAISCETKSARITGSEVVGNNKNLGIYQISNDRLRVPEFHEPPTKVTL